MNEPSVSITEPISSRRRAWNGTMRVLLYVSAVIICALLVFLIGYILYRGIPNLSWEFLTSEESVINDIEGILPSIVNTVYVIIATLIIVLPLGVGSAIYLTEYATNKKLVSIIEFATETLSGMPSIIFALVGMMVFLPGLRPRHQPDSWRAQPRYDDPADHHPHHSGEPQDRAAELPRRLPRPWQRQVAHDPHRRPAQQH